MITNGAFAEGDAFGPQYPHSLPLFAFSKKTGSVLSTAQNLEVRTYLQKEMAQRPKPKDSIAKNVKYGAHEVKVEFKCSGGAKGG